MLRHRRTRAAAAVVLLLAGCSRYFVLTVSNETDAPLTVSFRLGEPGSLECRGPEREAHMPASDLHRWFGEPRRVEAADVAFDPELCAVQATVPAQTALELVFHPGARGTLDFFPEGIEPTAKGSAGEIVIRGEQIERYLESGPDGPVLVYAARPPNEVRDKGREELRARRAPPAAP